MKFPDFISQAFTPILEGFAPSLPAGELDTNSQTEKQSFSEFWESMYPGETAPPLPEWLHADYSCVPSTSNLPFAVPPPLPNPNAQPGVGPSNAPHPAQLIASSSNTVASSGSSGVAQAPPMANNHLYNPLPVAPFTDITASILQNSPQSFASSSNNPLIPFAQVNADQQSHLGTGNASQIGTQWDDFAFDANMGMSWNPPQSGGIMNTQASNFYHPPGNMNFPMTQPAAPSSSIAGALGLQSTQTHMHPRFQQQRQQYPMPQGWQQYPMPQQQQKQYWTHQQQEQQYAMLQQQRQQGNPAWAQNMPQGQNQNTVGFGGWNVNMGQQSTSYLPNHASSSSQIARPPPRNMSPYPNMRPNLQYNRPLDTGVPSISNWARQSYNAQPPQYAQPGATRPAMALGNRTTVDHSAQLAQGSSRGTGEAGMTPGMTVLQSFFAPAPGGTMVPMAQAQSAASVLQLDRGKKRAREDEDEGEGEQPKKKVVKNKKRPTKPKQISKAKPVQNSNQLSPEPQGEGGAGTTHQQHAESESRLNTPNQFKPITGASQQASAPREKIDVSTLVIPKPDLKDPVFAKLFAEPLDLTTLSKVIPSVVPCHWGYDGTKPPCGHIFTGKSEFYCHMWDEHKADLVAYEAKVDCLWPGCTKWDEGRKAGTLTREHMGHGVHAFVLTKFLRLKCHQCKEFVGGSLEQWSRGTKKCYVHDITPYTDHAKHCTKGVDTKVEEVGEKVGEEVGEKVDEKADKKADNKAISLWQVCPVD